MIGKSIRTPPIELEVCLPSVPKCVENFSRSKTDKNKSTPSSASSTISVLTLNYDDDDEDDDEDVNDINPDLEEEVLKLFLK